MPKFLKLVSSHLIIDFFKFILKHFLDLLIFFFHFYIWFHAYWFEVSSFLSKVTELMWLNNE